MADPDRKTNVAAMMPIKYPSRRRAFDGRQGPDVPDGAILCLDLTARGTGMKAMPVCAGLSIKPLPENLFREPIDCLYADHCRLRVICSLLARLAGDDVAESAADIAPAVIAYLERDLPMHIADPALKMRTKLLCETRLAEYQPLVSRAVGGSRPFEMMPLGQPS